MNCRHCHSALKHVFLDLGVTPPSNAYLKSADLDSREKHYPLKLYVCEQCWLVQTEDYAEAQEFFSADYAYFSSTSSSWLEHAALYSEMITKKLNLTKKSFVIEVASNDGYLLKNFINAGIPCLGIEPTASTASAAKKLNIPIIEDFFSQRLAKKLSKNGQLADLIIANNVYAHVPDINDFTLGLKQSLKPTGTITLEFPHLLQMLKHNQFDTVYHEHFSYLSLYTVQKIFQKAGLKVWDVEQLPTHGGSLRIYGCHQDDKRTTQQSVNQIIKSEQKMEMQDLKVYSSFQKRAERIKNDLLRFLQQTKLNNKSIAAYGAAAKGNTLLNFAGVKKDLLPYVCDAALSKQGKFMPGSQIPILPPKEIIKRNPDYILILPWNIATEVTKQLQTKHLKSKFVVAIPEVKIIT